MKEPLFFMLLLIFGMFGVAFICRMYSVKFSDLTLAHLEIPGSNIEPYYVKATTNNLNNLFQLPPIFIGSCILTLSLDLETATLIFNAWGFVVSRYLHTVVHITFNNVLIRSAIFAAGLYFLASIWIELLYKV